MVVSDYTLNITGRPNEYAVRLECLGQAESVDAIAEMLRPILGNIRLTTAEVDDDLAAGGSYEAHSLPTQPKIEPGVFAEDIARL